MVDVVRFTTCDPMVKKEVADEQKAERGKRAGEDFWQSDTVSVSFLWNFMYLDWLMASILKEG